MTSLLTLRIGSFPSSPSAGAPLLTCTEPGFASSVYSDILAIPLAQWGGYLAQGVR